MPQRFHWLIAALLIAAVSAGLQGSFADGDKPTEQKRLTSREALAKFNAMIGGWKGVGQVKRSSNQGAWRETSEFVWKIDKTSSAIEYRVKDGKHFKSALIGWDAKAERFTLAAELPDGKKRDYVGQLDGDSLVVESKPDTDGFVSRVSIKQLNEIRLLVLVEQRRDGQSLYSRLGEVGYTREGEKLASSEQTGPVCVVSGGAGTIKLSHKGETYFVCCTGCRDAFIDDPETFIAEYKAKLVKKAK